MQYVKTLEMRMFDEKFSKSSWQHSAQWNILHFPDVQYRADGQTKYRAHFGVLHTSFIDGVGSYEVWCTLPHITLLVPEFPEERLMKFLSFLALVNSAAEDVKQVLSISNNLPLCAIVHTKGFFMENLIMINGKRNCQDAAEEEVAQK